MKLKSLLLVVLQFSFILLLLAGTKNMKQPVLFTIFLSVSVLLLVWAAVVMKKSRLRIMPDPHRNATLVNSGPYRLIRHPMYTAVLCAGIALLLAHFSYIRLFYWAALFVVLVSKLLYEEKMLSQKFRNYPGYMKKTFRIIPWVF